MIHYGPLCPRILFVRRDPGSLAIRSAPCSEELPHPGPVPFCGAQNRRTNPPAGRCHFADRKIAERTHPRTVVILRTAKSPSEPTRGPLSFCGPQNRRANPPAGRCHFADRKIAERTAITLRRIASSDENRGLGRSGGMAQGCFRSNPPAGPCHRAERTIDTPSRTPPGSAGTSGSADSSVGFRLPRVGSVFGTRTLSSLVGTG